MSECPLFMIQYWDLTIPWEQTVPFPFIVFPDGTSSCRSGPGSILRKSNHKQVLEIITINSKSPVVLKGALSRYLAIL